MAIICVTKEIPRVKQRPPICPSSPRQIRSLCPGWLYSFVGQLCFCVVFAGKELTHGGDAGRAAGTLLKGEPQPLSALSNG